MAALNLSEHGFPTAIGSPGGSWQPSLGRHLGADGSSAGAGAGQAPVTWPRPLGSRSEGLSCPGPISTLPLGFCVAERPHGSIPCPGGSYPHRKAERNPRVKGPAPHKVSLMPPTSATLSGTRCQEPGHRSLSPGKLLPQTTKKETQAQAGWAWQLGATSKVGVGEGHPGREDAHESSVHAALSPVHASPPSFRAWLQILIVADHKASRELEQIRPQGLTDGRLHPGALWSKIKCAPALAAPHGEKPARAMFPSAKAAPPTFPPGPRKVGSGAQDALKRCFLFSLRSGHPAESRLDPRRHPQTSARSKARGNKRVPSPVSALLMFPERVTLHCGLLFVH